MGGRSIAFLFLMKEEELSKKEKGKKVRKRLQVNFSKSLVSAKLWQSQVILTVLKNMELALFAVEWLKQS